MPELGFHDQSSSSSSSSATPAAVAARRSGFRARDASPDSVIFTLESNLSLFSSASASVDRCSFASDAHDHDSLVSEISLHLAGHDSEQQESSSGTDLDPNKPALHINRHRKGEKVKVLKDESDVDIALDSARSSFSLAIKECQERRARSEAFSKKLDRRRPASLDLNNVTTASSPRLGSIKKAPLTSRKSGNFPSPGTPNFRHASVGMQKGWSSERVPLHSNNGRKQGNALLLNGKTLPSKWEDAERWIFSPISGDGSARSSYPQPQRRPKSKSGPLGPPGVAYYSLYSPAMPMFDGGNVGNFMPASPFSAGVMAADGLAIRPSSHGVAFPTRAEPCMARSVSVHGCSEMLSHSSTTFPQDDDLDGVKDAATNVSRAVSRRDMATQMSPESSAHSSPKLGPSLIDANPLIPPIVELESGPSCRLEVRDVQVDERVTMTRWSKKNRSRIQGKGSDMFENWKKRDAGSPAWDISNTSKSLSKVKREEAKITAWENLQKAKAEAAIRKLEMKLEKKRSSSMDKIMKKLRSAQKRAQEMRSSASTNQAHQAGSHKVISFHRGKQMSSLSGCFTCHAF